MTFHSILIVDDHPTFRRGLVGLLEDFSFSKELHEAKSGVDALNVLRTVEIDLIFLDLEMPEMSGLEFLNQLKHLELKTMPKVVILSSICDPITVMYCANWGVSGYLPKTSHFSDFQQVFSLLREGEQYFDPKIRQILLSQKSTIADNFPANAELTQMEQTILTKMCLQLSIKEMAETLYISENTVKRHRYNMYHKIGTKNMLGAVIFGLGKGYISMDEMTRILGVIRPHAKKKPPLKPKDKKTEEPTTEEPTPPKKDSPDE
jgi:DNA-binding NarL/FixJ family response regulator